MVNVDFIFCSKSDFCSLVLLSESLMVAIMFLCVLSI